MQFNWIDVKEKLPEKDGKYIIYGFYAGIVIAIFKFGKFSRTWNFKPYGKVTHWMPIPDEPQKKDGDN